MHRLKNMKENLMCCVQNQMCNLATADTQELGAAIDMIKDLSETIYYCTITEAMEKSEKEKQSNENGHHSQMYYPEPMYMDRDYKYPYLRDMDRNNGKMYYDGGRRGGYMPMYYDNGNRSNSNGSSSNGNNGSSSNNSAYYENPMYNVPTQNEMMMMRDAREGRSPISRRMYMEAKEQHSDKAKQMKELEKYMQELSQDITEMIHDASPEEKQMLQQRISALASKIK